MTLQTVRWKTGHITVRPGTVQDALQAEVISLQLRNSFSEGEYGYWQPFGELCSQTVESDGLPFKPEKVRDGTAADQRAAYLEFLKLPNALKKKWQLAIAAAEEPIDIVLGPTPLAQDADPKA